MILWLVLSVSSANIPTPVVDFDTIQLNTTYKEVNIKKYDKMMEKGQYEKLLKYHSKQVKNYSPSDTEMVYEGYYIPSKIHFTALDGSQEAWAACLKEMQSLPITMGMKDL